MGSEARSSATRRRRLAELEDLKLEPLVEDGELFAPAEGTKPDAGPGAVALAALVGVWWAPGDRLFRITRDWRCTYTRPSDEERQMDIAWDSATKQIVIGRVLALKAADLEPSRGGAGEAMWYSQARGESA